MQLTMQVFPEVAGAGNSFLFDNATPTSTITLPTNNARLKTLALVSGIALDSETDVGGVRILIKRSEVRIRIGMALGKQESLEHGCCNLYICKFYIWILDIPDPGWGKCKVILFTN